MVNNSEIIIYKTEDGETSIDVKLDNETVWLTQKQMAKLFEKDVSTISKHIRKIYKDGELDNTSSQSNSTFLPIRQRPAVLYNLDMIISVGYRVNSKRGIQFRKWATKVLNKYLLEGYVANENKLKQIGKTIEVLQTSEKRLEAKQVLDVISKYHKALTLLDEYDRKELTKPKGKSNTYVLDYNECRDVVKKLKFNNGSKLFGLEKDDSFKGCVANIFQTFEGKEIYPSLQEKAANLLYLLVKDHCFVDGNKRIAASLFLYFLNKNDALFNNGAMLIGDDALVALTIMIAESNPREKDIMTTIIMRCLV